MCTQGVPQGSVLGPLFYIPYADDVVKNIKNCQIAMYADDTVLYSGNPDFGISLYNMREDVQALSGWCNNNGIKMNAEKNENNVVW